MYNNKKPLAIILTTYNSQKFLIQQLDSLYTQTYKEWNLYIRDDGSNDSTLEILNHYRNIYNNIFIITDNERGLGAKNNFFRILYLVDSDYYMFCDHDDIWLPWKIELTMKELKNAESQNPNKSIVLHTDLTIVNENSDIIDHSMWHYAKINPKILCKWNYCMVCCFMTGCTMGFNRIAKNELATTIPPEALMHDSWIAIQAVLKNAIILSIYTPTILYRIHSNNAVGIPNAKRSYFIRKIYHFATTIKNQSQVYPLLKITNYGSIYKYYYYKLLYTIRRNT